MEDALPTKIVGLLTIANQKNGLSGLHFSRYVQRAHIAAMCCAASASWGALRQFRRLPGGPRALICEFMAGPCDGDDRQLRRAHATMVRALAVTLSGDQPSSTALHWRMSLCRFTSNLHRFCTSKVMVEIQCDLARGVPALANDEELLGAYTQMATLHAVSRAWSFEFDNDPASEEEGVGTALKLARRRRLATLAVTRRDEHFKRAVMVHDACAEGNTYVPFLESLERRVLGREGAYGDVALEQTTAQLAGGDAQWKAIRRVIREAVSHPTHIP